MNTNPTQQQQHMTPDEVRARLTTLRVREEGESGQTHDIDVKHENIGQTFGELRNFDGLFALIHHHCNEGTLDDCNNIPASFSDDVISGYLIHFKYHTVDDVHGEVFIRDTATWREALTHQGCMALPIIMKLSVRTPFSRTTAAIEQLKIVGDVAWSTTAVTWDFSMNHHTITAAGILDNLENFYNLEDLCIHLFSDKENTLENLQQGWSSSGSGKKQEPPMTFTIQVASNCFEITDDASWTQAQKESVNSTLELRVVATKTAPKQS